MTSRDRREARAERLRGWAGKREERAAAVFEAGEPFTSDNAFNTQPGHMPFRARLIAREDRAYESTVKAAAMRSRADGIDGQLATSVYDDDPDAIEQLRARITRLEAERDAAKAANAAYRKEHKAELAKMTPYERGQAMPYPGYHFQNLSGNLSRQRARLARLERAQGRELGPCHICGGEADGECAAECGRPVCDEDAQMKDHDRYCTSCLTGTFPAPI